MLIDALLEVLLIAWTVAVVWTLRLSWGNKLKVVTAFSCRLL